MRAKWILLTAAVVVVGGAVAMRSASAAQSDPDEVPHGNGWLKHGIYHEGCEVFRLEDPEALQTWAMGRKLFFAPWLMKIDEVKEDPEPFMLAVFGELFPQCEWPPSETARFNGASWESSVEIAKREIANFELSSSGGLTEDNAPQAFASMFLSFWRRLPRPEPMPPKDSEGAPEPSAARALRTVEDFAAFDLGEVVDPEPGQLAPARTLVVGHDDGWLGWPDTLAELEKLARARPDLTVVHFSFTDTRELFGLPSEGDSVAWLASAVDPAGVPMAQPMTGSNLASGPLSSARLGALVDHAAVGLPLPPKASIDYLEVGGQAFTIMIHPDGAKGYRWWVWKGVRGPESTAVGSGKASTKPGARRSAETAATAAAQG